MEIVLRLAYHYLKYRSRTVWEMRLYLQKKAQKYRFSPDEIEKTVAYLLEERLLDDHRFIDEFVRSRALLKPKSEYVLRLELARHGVNEETIDTYFESHPVDSDSLAEEALRARIRSLQRIPNEKEREQKAIQLLQRRGFTFSVAKKTYRKMREQIYR